jgi:hypothetical protein
MGARDEPEKADEHDCSDEGDEVLRGLRTACCVHTNFAAGAVG